MLKQNIILLFGLLFFTQINGQKVGFVNIESVLKKAPEYNSAQEKLTSIWLEWMLRKKA